MKKLNSKQIFTYVVLFGVLLLVVVYFMVYQKNMEKAEALEISNKKLEDRVDSLKIYYDEQAKNEAAMEVLKVDIDKFLEEYPANSLEEDVIMQAVHTQMATPIKYDLINIKEKESFKLIEESTVKGANVEKYQEAINFEMREASYVNDLDYRSLKEAIQSIFDSEYYIGISKISYNKKDLEGHPTLKAELRGSLDLIFYSVDGTGKEYVKPEMMPYMAGTEDIFNLLIADLSDEE